jgi:hypothetical protein
MPCCLPAYHAAAIGIEIDDGALPLCRLWYDLTEMSGSGCGHENLG